MLKGSKDYIKSINLAQYTELTLILPVFTHKNNLMHGPLESIHYKELK